MTWDCRIAHWVCHVCPSAEPWYHMGKLLWHQGEALHGHISSSLYPNEMLVQNIQKKKKKKRWRRRIIDVNRGPREHELCQTHSCPKYRQGAARVPGSAAKDTFLQLFSGLFCCRHWGFATPSQLFETDTGREGEMSQHHALLGSNLGPCMAKQVPFQVSCLAGPTVPCFMPRNDSGV